MSFSDILQEKFGEHEENQVSFYFIINMLLIGRRIVFRWNIKYT